MTFALCFETEKDWRLADTIMEDLPETDTLSIQDWWGKVAKNGDVEGFLVHYFLLRHRKINDSRFGTVESLSKKLASEISTFPNWLLGSTEQ